MFDHPNAIQLIQLQHEINALRAAGGWESVEQENLRNDLLGLRYPYAYSSDTGRMMALCCAVENEKVGIANAILFDLFVLCGIPSQYSESIINYATHYAELTLIVRRELYSENTNWGILREASGKRHQIPRQMTELVENQYRCIPLPPAHPVQRMLF
jgi:hypothetical protein